MTNWLLLPDQNTREASQVASKCLEAPFELKNVTVVIDIWIKYTLDNSQWGTADAEIKTSPHPLMGAQGYQSSPLHKRGV